MTHTIRIYVPTAIPDEVHEQLHRDICENHGGLTAWRADGKWVGPNGEIHDEPVQVVETHVDDELGGEWYAALYAEHLQQKTDETEIMTAVSEESTQTA